MTRAEFIVAAEAIEKETEFLMLFWMSIAEDDPLGLRIREWVWACRDLNHDDEAEVDALLAWREELLEAARRRVV